MGEFAYARVVVCLQSASVSYLFFERCIRRIIPGDKIALVVLTRAIWWNLTIKNQQYGSNKTAIYDAVTKS